MFDVASGLGSMKHAMTQPTSASGAIHRYSGTSASLYEVTTTSKTGCGRCATMSGVMLFACAAWSAAPGTPASPSCRFVTRRVVKSVPTSDMPSVPPTCRK